MEVRGRVAVAACAALLTVVTSCGEATRPASGSTPPAHPMTLLPSTLLAPSSSPGPIRVERITDWVTTGEVSFACLFGTYVSWGEENPVTRTADRVMVRDLTTGITKLVARADKIGGTTDWSRGFGDNLVYTDQDPSNEGESRFNDAPWRLYHVNLATGARTLLDQSKPGERSVVPSAQISGTRVVWGHGGQGDPETGDLLGLDLATGKRTVLLRRVVVENYYGVDGDDVVYAQRTAAGTDLWRTSFSRPGKAVRVTTSGRIGRYHVGNGLVAYEYTSPPPVGDPDSIWVMPIRGGKAVRLVKNEPDIFSGIGVAQDAVPGRNLVAWFGQDGGIDVAFADNPGRVVSVQGENVSVPARFDWDGDRLVWGSEQDSGSASITTLHVARITRTR